MMLTAKSPDDLPQVAKAFLDSTEPGIVILRGEMGAGKTTFIKAICTELGVEDAVSSPTFSLVNEYLTSGGESVYHFDFYRVEDESEAYDIGYEHYFFSGNRCFIEWPERIEGLIPEDVIEISVKVSGSERIFTWT